MNPQIDPVEFEKYWKTKNAFLNIYLASFNPTSAASVSLTYEECALLIGLFDKKEIIGFVS